MIWAFDPQGRVVPIPDGVLDANKCGEDVFREGVLPPGWFAQEARAGGGSFTTSELDPRVSPNSWCASMGIVLSVILVSPDPKFISATLTMMMDMPMAVRAEKATTVWWKETVEKLRQEQIQKSNQVKPKL
jgi:hypothetical protein